ncbi:MAG: hypothetical protein RLY40_447 [Pseudomonadota bacterium]|jgi:hypothetical protein
MKEDVGLDLNLDELFAQLAELTQSSEINQQAYLYLLQLWAYFEVAMVDGTDESGSSGIVTPFTHPTILELPHGFQIFDYSTHLKTAAGKYYGSYTTGRLLNTVREMIKLLSERGAKRVQLLGLDAAKRFASLECEKYKIKVVNFTPDNKTQLLRDRLPRLDSLRNSVYTVGK